MISSDLFAAVKPMTDLIADGGPVVMLLICLSVIALALTIAKAIQFLMLRVGRHGPARDALAMWLAGHRDEAQGAIYHDRSMSSDILRHLFRAASHPGIREDALREDIERVAQDRLMSLRSFLRALDMIAQTAPLIGLFGTVIGMIEAFQAMQGAGATVDPSVLAGGIWVALLTTAVGLAIAIPTSAIVGWFDSRVERQQTAIEGLVTAFFTGAVAEREMPNIVTLSERQRKPAPADVGS